MYWSATFELLGKLVSGLAAIAGGWWAFEKWHRREEHFPRVYFEVSVNFIGVSQGQIVAELVATLENKGVVPLKIRGQLYFPHVLAEGDFIPSTWAYTFIYPGVKTEYNYVCALPSDTLFVRMQGDFKYLSASKSHHAAKVLKVPTA